MATPGTRTHKHTNRHTENTHTNTYNYSVHKHTNQWDDEEIVMPPLPLLEQNVHCIFQITQTDPASKKQTEKESKEEQYSGEDKHDDD